MCVCVCTLGGGGGEIEFLNGRTPRFFVFLSPEFCRGTYYFMMAPFPPALDAPALDHHMFQVVLGARLSSVKKGSEMFPDVPPPFQLPFGRKKNHFSARPLWFPLPNDVSIKKKEEIKKKKKKKKIFS